MALFTFEDVTFSYPGADRAALDGVSLAVEAGEFVLLCGQSGSGKTTLLRHGKTALAPHGKRTGRVLLRDRLLDEVPALEQACAIGYVAQDPEGQLAAETVGAEVALGLESAGVPASEMRLRVAETVALFGIEGWLHRPTAKLSGGQKQLVNLAAAVAADPAVLLLDEPAAQLDPVAAERFFAMVHKLNRDLGVTVVLSAHNVEEVFGMADRVAVLDKGRLLALGDPRTVAARLHAAASPLEAALPAPVRIYQQVTGQGAADAPLSVREGRRWLGEYLGGVDAEVDAPTATAASPVRVATPSAPWALRARDLRFRYGREGSDVLSGLSLAVPEGAFVALVGGNGAGKTTLLKVLAGTLRAYGGSVELFGQRMRGVRGGGRFSAEVALLPQDPTLLFSRETVREELAEMEGVLRGGAERVALPVLVERCGIGPLLDRHPLDLSGGERQRVALAKMLACAPRLLLLDEPTKGLDVLAADALAALLGEVRRQGATVVFASHDVEFCARFADWAALLFEGEIVAEGTPGELFSGGRLYTTAAHRMARDFFPEAVTAEAVVAACRRSGADAGESAADAGVGTAGAVVGAGTDGSAAATSTAAAGAAGEGAAR